MILGSKFKYGDVLVTLELHRHKFSQIGTLYSEKAI